MEKSLTIPDHGETLMPQSLTDRIKPSNVALVFTIIGAVSASAGYIVGETYPEIAIKTLCGKNTTSGVCAEQKPKRAESSK